MENQVITPTQNNPVSPGPEPTPPVTPPTPVNPPIPPVSGFTPGPDIGLSSGSGSGKFGRLSLAFGAFAVGLFILLIFVTGLIDSLTKAYIWFFIILALGVSGLVMGLISEKSRERISLTGLLGIILSVMVCVTCLIVGSYYIKIQMALNDFQSSLNSSTSSTSTQDLNLDYPSN